MPASRRLTVPFPGGPDVVLTPPTPADADVITDLCQDPGIQEWTTVPSPYTRADADHFLADVAGNWAAGTSLTWAIRADGELVGMIGLDIQPLGSAEIGYWVAAHARGRGLMSAVVATVVEHAFDPDGVDLDRLVWHAFVGNHASRRVAEKAGFGIEGLIRGDGIQRGARRDGWVGTLLRTDPRPGPR